MSEQKILPIVNVEKFYVALLKSETKDKVEYGDAIYLEGIKEFGVKLKVNSDPFYHEGRKVFDETTLADINITINLTGLSDKDECLLLGHKMAKEGGIIRNENDIAPEVAILIKSNKARGIDRYEVLYAGTFSEPDTDKKSKEGKSNFQTLKLEANFRPLKSGLWSYKVDSDSANSEETIKSFFTKVIVPTATDEITSK